MSRSYSRAPSLAHPPLLLLLFLTMTAVSCAGGARERSRPPLEIHLKPARPAPEQPYSGSESCGECHRKIYLFWSGTGHAGSLESLDPGAERRNPSCLRCHSTGYGEQSGYVDEILTPQLSSVGCESCHGPGGDHAGSTYPALVPVAGSDDCRGCDVGRVCRRCHTTGRSPAFELEGALASVSCAQADPREDPATGGIRRGKR